MIKLSVARNKTIPNLYALYNVISKYENPILTKIQGEMEKAIMLGDLNSLLSVTARSSKQNIRRNIEDFNNTIK